MSFDRIIEEVRARPELWFRRHPAYTHRPHKNKIWGEIARKLRSDETLLRKRWKHLKDQYRKELKKIQANDNKTPRELINTWTYFNSMEFMQQELMPQPKIEKTSTSDTDPDEETLMEALSACAEGHEPTEAQKIDAADKRIQLMSKKINKLNNLVETHINTCLDDTRKDPDYMFLMSLLPSMKQLNDIQKLQFRGAINDWLLDAATQNEFTQCDNNISNLFVQAQLDVKNEETTNSTSITEQ